MGNFSINVKYAHLKLKKLPTEWSYYMYSNRDDFFKSIAQIETFKANCCTFMMPGEYSIVTDAIGVQNSNVVIQSGWNAFMIEGDMPFGTVQGLIATISNTLKSEGIGVCVISTYLTDLFLVKSKNYNLAKKKLQEAGWDFVNE